VLVGARQLDRLIERRIAVPLDAADAVDDGGVRAILDGLPPLPALLYWVLFRGARPAARARTPVRTLLTNYACVLRHRAAMRFIAEACSASMRAHSGVVCTELAMVISKGRC